MTYTGKNKQVKSVSTKTSKKTIAKPKAQKPKEPTPPAKQQPPALAMVQCRICGRMVRSDKLMICDKCGVIRCGRCTPLDGNCPDCALPLRRM